MAEKILSAEPSEEEMPRRGRGWGSIVVVVLVLVIGGALLWKVGVFNKGTSAASGYQAVFLANDQVYFGKVKNPNSQYVTLSDIYYLQVTQQLQPPADTPAQSLQLVKLGNELHGPTDEMRINRDHILFLEDLKADSNIVKTIRDYQTKQESK